ncbi:hypothetical protein Mal4_01590 [Maioricimonas rarisocia]|uniref:STAS domain-containing protein n=1 Tax=Maioricimonas rarisocia TaxID=2528026 RepID=A0A517Z066_9PLAN|nr:STAS domain-containing protein [Maioricimonas rarisocia]QDU35877.1 hypothetical protein Mal4_01590 [Maioricimonas rarisocia]
MTGHAARIETLPEFRALVLHLNDSQLGSLQTASIKQLENFLHSLPSYLPGEHVIVDLSSVRYYGAAFLTLLVDLQKNLRTAGRHLMVTGDRLGLIRFSRLPITSFETTGAALHAVSERDSILAAAV